MGGVKWRLFILKAFTVSSIDKQFWRKLYETMKSVKGKAKAMLLISYRYVDACLLVPSFKFNRKLRTLRRWWWRWWYHFLEKKIRKHQKAFPFLLYKFGFCNNHVQSQSQSSSVPYSTLCFLTNNNYYYVIQIICNYSYRQISFIALLYPS